MRHNSLVPLNTNSWTENMIHNIEEEKECKIYSWYTKNRNSKLSKNSKNSQSS